MLESNLGYSRLHRMVALGRSKVGSITTCQNSSLQGQVLWLGLHSLLDLNLKSQTIRKGCILQVTPEAAQRMLKDLMFERWSMEGCQSGPEIVKLLSLVDFYLPFLPLERDHIQELFRAKLAKRREEMLADTQEYLTWGDEVVKFLREKVGVGLGA